MGWYIDRYNDEIWNSWEEFDSREEAIYYGIEEYKDAINNNATYLFDDEDLNPQTDTFFIGGIKNFYTNS